MKLNVQLIIPFIFPLLLFVLWIIVFELKGKELSYIIDPRLILDKIGLIKYDLLINTLYSLFRLTVGVIIGTILGIKVGISLGRRSDLWRFFGPTMNVLTAIPIIVLIPFLFIIFGFNELFRISVVSTVVFFIVYQSVYKSIFNFPRQLLELAVQREKSEKDIIRSMLFPSIKPEIVNAIRLSLLFAWLGIALAEKAVAVIPYGGLGYQILRSQELGKYEELFAAACVLGMVALVIDLLIGYYENAVSHWRERYLI